MDSETRFHLINMVLWAAVSLLGIANVVFHYAEKADIKKRAIEMNVAEYSKVDGSFHYTSKDFEYILTGKKESNK